MQWNFRGPLAQLSHRRAMACLLIPLVLLVTAPSGGGLFRACEAGEHVRVPVPKEEPPKEPNFSPPRLPRAPARTSTTEVYPP
jgi:hypothetical protein